VAWSSSRNLDKWLNLSLNASFSIDCTLWKKYNWEIGVYI
jgi:hypothetical protein